MMYLVVFTELYVGDLVDEDTRIFKTKEEAEKYCNKLNEDYARICRCPIEDLGDYYKIYEIKIG